MSASDLHDFTGQLSMLYQNWPGMYADHRLLLVRAYLDLLYTLSGPIRVPAPVMYATK